MSQVSVSLAYFLGVVFQTLLVGLFIPLFIVASYAQWKKVSMGRKVNLVMAFTTAFFGLSIISNWVLGVNRMISAALYLPSGMTADQYLLPPYSMMEVVRKGIFQFEIVIGDLLMIYRMYHIYNKSLLVCAIPSITTGGLFAISCGLTYQRLHFNTPADFKAYDIWTTACFCVSLFNTGFMTVCIILRLWKVHRETAASDANIKDPVILQAMKVLVESAALWTLFVAINFFAFLAKSNLKDTFLTMTSPVVGISFCLIIARLGFMVPEVRNDSWQSSQPSHTSMAFPTPASLNRIKVDRVVYVSESESGVVDFRMISPTPPREK